MVCYKIKDKKTGEYRFNNSGVDSVNTSLGTINGNSLYFSALDIEAMEKVEDD